MSSVTRYPTTNAAGTGGFTNAGNAYSSNDSYATAAPGTNSTISSYFGGFDFASYIPAGATINSVTVYCERKFSTTAASASSTLRPYNLTTALATENENTTEPTTDTEYSVNFGALGVTDVRSADFRILVGAKRGSGSTGYTYSLDVVYVTVDYTATAAYSLTCDYASFAVSGQVAALLRSLKLTCDYTSLYLIGQSSILGYGRKLSLDPGLALVYGQAVTLLKARKLVTDYASFTLSGQVTSLIRSLKLTCDYTSLYLIGQSSILGYGRKLSLDPGLVLVYGHIAALLRARRLDCTTPANYIFSGQWIDYIYIPVGTEYSLTCDYASFAVSGQGSILGYGRNLSLDPGLLLVYGQAITFIGANYPLTCDHAVISLTGQALSFRRTLILVCNAGSVKADFEPVTFINGQILAITETAFTITGQDITLTYNNTGIYTLEAQHASFAVTTQSVSYCFGYNLTCLYRGFNLTTASVQFFLHLWEPTGDMITLGTLLTRIQAALGDTNGAIWNRTMVIWPFATDAIRDFPILRPKTTAYTVAEAGHSFTLPADFRKLIYVEFPPYQDPPAYLQRKAHLGTDFFGEDGFCDLDRDYDSGGDYLLWVSNSLIVGDIVIVRYLATHTTEFANEYSYITIENQYVQVIINHVVMMCYQERLALQLQDPTAHTSTIQQMSDAVKTAEANYLDLLKRAQEDIANSQRVSGWKVDKHDRIY